MNQVRTLRAKRPRAPAPRGNGHQDTSDPVALFGETSPENRFRLILAAIEGGKFVDAARITHSKVTLPRELLDLRVVLDHAVEIAHPILDETGHDFQLKIAVGSLAVNGDVTRLAQVVSNLLINAAKYTPAGGQLS